MTVRYLRYDISTRTWPAAYLSIGRASREHGAGVRRPLHVAHGGAQFEHKQGFTAQKKGYVIRIFQLYLYFTVLKLKEETHLYATFCSIFW